MWDNEGQRNVDLALFLNYLIYVIAVKKNFTRKDFQEVVTRTYNSLPVRGGGSKSMGFWENICKFYNVPIVYKKEDSEWLEDSVVIHLADTIWLAYDQERKLAADKQNKQDLEFKKITGNMTRKRK